MCNLIFVTTLFFSFCAQAMMLGQERLGEPDFIKLLLNKRVGALVHHASRDHQGQHIVDRLVSMPGIQLKMIFAPEHGYRTLNDENVADSQDSVTGLPVYSLYGPRQAPTAEMLAQLDVVIVELQDVGLRYYTYPATVTYLLRACAKAGVKVLLLDRPNPLGGERVEGAMLDPELARGGLTTIASVPTRYGMTLGEFALYLNDQLAIHADLVVVPMSGWSPNMNWQSTEVPWTPPSPALLTPEQTLLYAALGPLEAGNLSVGRGLSNTEAFRNYGAPWITSAQQDLLVKRLQKAQVEGIEFTPVTWTPDRALFTGKLCRGFRAQLKADIELDGFGALTRVLKAMTRTLQSAFDLSDMLSMVGGNWVFQGLEQSWMPDQFGLESEKRLKRFLRLREAYLLYPRARSHELH